MAPGSAEYIWNIYTQEERGTWQCRIACRMSFLEVLTNICSSQTSSNYFTPCFQRCSSRAPGHSAGPQSDSEKSTFIDLPGSVTSPGMRRYRYRSPHRFVTPHRRWVRSPQNDLPGVRGSSLPRGRDNGETIRTKERFVVFSCVFFLGIS